MTKSMLELQLILPEGKEAGEDWSKGGLNTYNLDSEQITMF